MNQIRNSMLKGSSSDSMRTQQLLAHQTQPLSPNIDPIISGSLKASQQSKDSHQQQQ